MIESLIKYFSLAEVDLAFRASFFIGSQMSEWSRMVAVDRTGTFLVFSIRLRFRSESYYLLNKINHLNKINMLKYIPGTRNDNNYMDSTNFGRVNLVGF